MVRREIKNFDVIYEGKSYLGCLPFTFGKVLSEAGISSVDGQISLESDIFVDEAALAMRHFYLRIKSITFAADLYIGDSFIGHTDGVTPVYNFKLTGLLSKGNNTLSIRPQTPGKEIWNGGIFGTVELIRFSTAIINRVSTAQKQEDGKLIFDIWVDLIGDESGVRAVATLISPSGQMHYCGLTKGRGRISISDPLYWWPRGQGVQNLYRLCVSLYGENDMIDGIEIRLGLRTARATEGGNIIVNGNPTLPMGAVYIPEPLTDLERAEALYDKYVSAAAMAGYNCLVIPCDATIPAKKFYDLCDVYGIMVIEEHSSLSPEQIDSLHYRAKHPSLCLIDLVGEGDRREEIERLSEKLPDLGVKVMKTYPVYPSSPALPSMKTLRPIIPEEERGLFSYPVEAIAEEGAIRQMLIAVSERYPYPAGLSDFAYASALAGANKIGDSIKKARLSSGESGRAVYYRLNDSELTVSDSAIDCRGRWKPLQYCLSRHFTSLAVYADYDEGRIIFSASNHRKTDCICTLEYRIADSENNTVYSQSVECSIERGSVAELHIDNIGKYIFGHEREYYLEYFLKEGSFAVSKKTMLFVPEKHFLFKKPKFKTVLTGQDRRFSLTIASDVFVKDMEIDFDGVDVIFDDNYFDLTSDAPVKISFTVIGGIETAFHLKDIMQLRSVFDLR